MKYSLTKKYDSVQCFVHNQFQCPILFNGVPLMCTYSHQYCTAKPCEVQTHLGFTIYKLSLKKDLLSVQPLPPFPARRGFLWAQDTRFKMIGQGQGWGRGGVVQAPPRHQVGGVVRRDMVIRPEGLVIIIHLARIQASFV